MLPFFSFSLMSSCLNITKYSPLPRSCPQSLNHENDLGSVLKLQKALILYASTLIYYQSPVFISLLPLGREVFSLRVKMALDLSHLFLLSPTHMQPVNN